MTRKKTPPRPAAGMDPAPPAAERRRRAKADEGRDLIEGASMANVLAASRHLQPSGRLAAEVDNRLVGIPLGALSLRVLFQSTGIPVGRILHLFGPSGSGKSSLAMELARMFSSYPSVTNPLSGGHYVVNEMRAQKVLHDSIYENNPKLLETIWVPLTRSMEEWQDLFTGHVNDLNNRFGLGGVPFPGIFVVDSVLGTASQAVIDDILNVGHASLNFSREANLLNIYTKAFPTLIDQLPVLLVLTNHQKKAMSKPGSNVVEWKTPGGDSIKFYSTYEIEMRKVSSYRKLDAYGERFRLRTLKNSLGTSRYTMEVDMEWWFDVVTPDGERLPLPKVKLVDGELPEGFEAQQTTVFDWHAASIGLLLKCDYAGESGADTLKKRAAAIVDLEVEGSTGRVTSKKLGVKRVLPFDAGLALEANEPVRKALDLLFHIHEVPPFQIGVPYRDQGIEAPRPAEPDSPPVLPAPETSDGT